MGFQSGSSSSRSSRSGGICQPPGPSGNRQNFNRTGQSGQGVCRLPVLIDLISGNTLPRVLAQPRKNKNYAKTVSLPFMLLGILFNVCLVASNLLETKVIQLGPITATAGLIVFPISYIINDCIAEVWGFKKARLIIWSGFAMNFLTIGFARLAITLPAAPFWEGEESFNFIFGLAPRIAIASLLAFLLGSFLNAYIMSK